jgi:hypothetical protein
MVGIKPVKGRSFPIDAKISILWFLSRSTVFISLLVLIPFNCLHFSFGSYPVQLSDNEHDLIRRQSSCFTTGLSSDMLHIGQE